MTGEHAPLNQGNNPRDRRQEIRGQELKHKSTENEHSGLKKESRNTHPRGQSRQPRLEHMNEELQGGVKELRKREEG